MMWNQFPGFPHPQKRPDICVWEVQPLCITQNFYTGHEESVKHNQGDIEEVALLYQKKFNMPAIDQKWLLCERKFSDYCCTILLGKIQEMRQKRGACLFLVALLCWCNFSCSQKEVCKMLSCPVCSMLQPPSFYTAHGEF